jgi:hypothetical protein
VPIDGEELVVQEGDFLRFDPTTTRCPVAGPNGLTLLAVGAPRGNYVPQARSSRPRPGQSTSVSGKPTPAANRSSRYGVRSNGGVSPSSSAATAAPTAGDCMKPWPEKPQAA